MADSQPQFSRSAASVAIFHAREDRAMPRLNIQKRTITLTIADRATIAMPITGSDSRNASAKNCNIIALANHTMGTAR
jgi:hypothetical protein